MKKRRVIGVGTAVIAVIIVISMAAGLGLFTNINGDRKPELVKTATAKLSDVYAYLSTTAIIKSKNKVEYYGLPAKVEKVNVKVGSQVRMGDTLLVYEKQDTATPMRLAQIQYDNAKLAKNELINQNNDIKKQIVVLKKQIKDLGKSSDPTIKAKIDALNQRKDQLRTITYDRFKQADNSIESARLSLVSASRNDSKNKTKIIAKKDGVVTNLNAVAGGLGSGSQIAIVVQDLTNLKALVTLGKYDASKVQLGQGARISIGRSAFATYKNSVAGKVSFINPVATQSQAGDATLGVELDIFEQTNALKIDFTADIDILTASAINVIAVPSECIRYEKGGKTLVYFVKKGIIEIRDVELGVISETNTQVLKGVAVGDKLVLNPATILKNGTEVVGK